MASRARALYYLGPIRARLGTELDRAAVAAWAAAAGRVRLSTVELESAALRSVTETGPLSSATAGP